MEHRVSFFSDRLTANPAQNQVFFCYILFISFVVLYFSCNFLSAENLQNQNASQSTAATLSPQPAFPVFLADLPNPNDFSLFANGGWDGNWYVGYNTCWIQKVAAPAKENFERAFIGARLGRMKNYQIQGKAPWEKKAFDGEIYMGLSSTPTWNRSQSYFLTPTHDIPFEPDSENAIEGVGESRWFWVEVPLKLVNFGGENYLAIWSKSEKFTSVSSSPILAAGWGSKEVNSWVNHDIKGWPLSDPAKAISTPVTVFEPAIALKLIPKRKETDIIPKATIAKIENGKARGKFPAPKIVCGIVEGISVNRSWIELSIDPKTWTRYGRYLWTAPYCFTLKMEDVPIGPDGKTWVRIAVADAFETIAYSDPINLFDQ